MLRTLATLTLLGCAYGQPDILILNRNADDSCNFTTSFGYPEYNCSKTIAFFTHGWLGTANDAEFAKIVSSATQFNGYQSFYFAWPELASNWMYIPTQTDYCGKCFGQYLVENIYNVCGKDVDVQISGHSLGAHLAGYAGFNVQQKGFEVSKINSWDAALPGYFGFNLSYALTCHDAKVTNRHHVNAWILGDPTDCDDQLNIYWNDGTFQPDCWWLDFPCNHWFIISIMGEAWYNKPNNFTGNATEIAYPYKVGIEYAIDDLFKIPGTFHIKTNAGPHYGQGYSGLNQ